MKTSTTFSLPVELAHQVDQIARMTGQRVSHVATELMEATIEKKVLAAKRERLVRLEHRLTVIRADETFGPLLNKNEGRKTLSIPAAMDWGAKHRLLDILEAADEVENLREELGKAA